MAFRCLVTHSYNSVMNLPIPRLFLTTGHPCGYLPGLTARSLVVDPNIIDNHVYSILAQQGFRRSGDNVYRPHCSSCAQCLSLRIPVAMFHPDRSQRRTWNRNRDLHVQAVPARFNPHHYKLFRQYLEIRHPNGGMNETPPEGYLAFISSSWSDSLLYEFKLQQRLLAVAVTDQLENALSAVYTFFDPHEAERSLGTYAILWQLDEAKRRGLRWLYLGYWVKQCAKMTYKANFRPHQVFVRDHWSPS